MLDIASRADPVPPPSTVARGLGRSFVDAIVAGDFDRLQALLAPDVRFRAIIPAEFQEAATAAGARAFVEDWFGGTDPRELLGWTAELVGDRLSIGYRIRLMDAGNRRIVEQHVAATFDGALLRDLALVCTGFRPLAAASGSAETAATDSPRDAERVGAPAISPGVVPAARLDATGLSCATLTPTIRSAVNELDFGAVLEIVTDDPEAEEGLRSWTRLTGNELVAAEAGPGLARRFAIRRTPRDAATITRKGTN